MFFIVIRVHSQSNPQNFHPHLHVMASDGGFTPDGVFLPSPAMSLAPIDELFRHRGAPLLVLGPKFLCVRSGT